METKYICADPDGLWHVGKRKESIGPRTGKVLSVWYVTACSGRTLGGPWGQTEKADLPANAGLCSRCKAIQRHQNGRDSAVRQVAEHQARQALKETGEA